MKITDIFHNMQALYEMQEQLARMEPKLYKIIDDLADNEDRLEYAAACIEKAKTGVADFLEKLESADVEIEL